MKMSAQQLGGPNMSQVVSLQIFYGGYIVLVYCRFNL